MEITDVRIKLVNSATDRLKAFCSVTLDDEFVIRDIKLVEGAGGLFVAMPSRKLSASCPDCRHKNPLRAHFCSECGAELPRLELPVDDHGRLRLYRDIAHPITPEFREKMQALIVETYTGEQERSAKPDYEPATDVDLDDVMEDESGDQRDQSSEYAALIAGLDPGSRSEGDRSQQGQRGEEREERPPDSRGGRQREERSDGGHRRDDSRGGQRRRGGRRRKPDGERRQNVTEPRTAPAAMVSATDGSPEKPVFEKPKASRKERAAPTPRAESDRVALSAATDDAGASESLDDTAAFGAGIL